MPRAILSGGKAAVLLFLISCVPPTPPTPKTDSPRVTTNEALSLEEVEALFAGLPSLPAPKERKKSDLVLPPTPPPPPPAGAERQAAFALSEESAPAPEVSVEALKVLRYQPEGEVDIAPELTISFSQPMVPLASVGEVSAVTPVRLSPAVEGEWRWLGTRLFKFTPNVRFPMASDFTVEIPAGTKSVLGGTLSSDVRFSFSTPPPRLLESVPYNQEKPVALSPLLWLAFDQKISPQALLPFLQATAAGRSFPLRLATEAEIKKVPGLTDKIDGRPQGTWIALKPEKPFPENTQIQITLAAGAPSKEGPKVTKEPQSFSFTTYGPMKVKEHRCGWERNGACNPYDSWYVTFSNPIDKDAFQDDMVTVSPALKNQRVWASGREITIYGTPSPNTRYQVTLSKDIPSAFGQTLGEKKTFSFDVGPYPPSLYSPGGDFVVVDSLGGTYYPVLTDGLKSIKVSAYKVEPEDFPAYLAYRQRVSLGKPATPPGKRAFSKTLSVIHPDNLGEGADIDLSSVLPDGLGNVVLVIEPGHALPKKVALEPIRAWVQFTKISLSASVDDGELVAWATSLEEGKPLAGVSLSLFPGGATAESSEDGLAFLPLSESGENLLIARLGKDVAFLPRDTSWYQDVGDEEEETAQAWSPWAPVWQKQKQREQLSWYLASDRRLYRPGEEAKIKGFVRLLDMGEGGGVRSVAGYLSRVHCKATDAWGKKLAEEEVELTALGGFEFGLTLPEDINLGTTVVNCEAKTSLEGGSASVYLDVREFRRPEFEIKTEAGQGPFIAGEVMQPEVRASYYAGGVLKNAPVAWEYYFSKASFSPPGREDFAFGPRPLWWQINSSTEYSERSTQSPLNGQTDSAGKHRFDLTLPSFSLPYPYTVRVESTVKDVNRQAWTGKDTALVHPASLYVGLRSKARFYFRGEPIDFEALVVDLDGNAVSGHPITFTAELIDYHWDSSAKKYEEKLIDRQSCQATSTEKPVRCVIKPQGNGMYQVTARITDEKGRENFSQISLWVFDLGAWSSNSERELSLKADKEEYHVGDTARLVLLSSFYPAEALVSIRRAGVLSTERISINGPSTRIDVPIREEYIPNLYVCVDLIQQQSFDPESSGLPIYRSTSVELSISPESRRLKVTVEPRKKTIRPGGETTLDVTLKDAEGKPVSGGEVAVVVVDEAVLALAGDYRLPDPLPGFYPRRGYGVTDGDLRDYALLVVPEMYSGRWGSGTGGGAGYGAGGGKLLTGKANASPPAMRGDFRPLALFVGALTTDKEGKAKVALKVPDNLTRYRIMAVAAAGEGQFGRGESTLVARLPLMARPSPPRFLRVDDSFALPVVLQNQTEKPLLVEVAARAVGVELKGATGYRVEVPANDRVEVRFLGAAPLPGEAHFQVVASGGGHADAATFSLPIYTPVTTETFATYGQLSGGALAQPLSPPKGAIPGYGGLTLTASSTALSGLSDAFLYLSGYPYECSEQLSSRLLGVAALGDVLEALGAEDLPSREAMEKAVERDIKRLMARQNEDGSFGFWLRGAYSWPFLSVHVSHALARIKEAGYVVPSKTLERAAAYLRDIEKHLPEKTSRQVKDITLAYALYVRELLHDGDVARAKSLIAERGKDLPVEARLFLLAAYAKDSLFAEEASAGLRDLFLHITENAKTAEIAISYTEGDSYLLFNSSRRADALGLMALLSLDPENELVHKLVAGLMGHRKAGHWRSTQENAFVLLALKRYFEVYEKDEPDFLLRAWLGESLAGEAPFKGREVTTRQLSIDLDDLSATDLILSKEGAGMLHYRMGLTYAIGERDAEALDRGFVVERSYEGLDDPGAVFRDESGAWRIKAGARVRVRVTMIAPSRRYHVALVDHLPGGLEAQDTGLATTSTSSGASVSWYDRWYQHRTFRDDRVEAFNTLLGGGVYELVYTALATTPGAFAAPPAKAEEMYAPETFGRSAGDRVIIE